MNLHGLWRTISRIVDAGHVPPPIGVATGRHGLQIKVRTAAEVDTWAGYLGLAPGRPTYIGGTQDAYMSIDFQSGSGWCGWTAITVYANCSTRVPA